VTITAWHKGRPATVPTSEFTTPWLQLARATTRARRNGSFFLPACPFSECHTREGKPRLKVSKMGANFFFFYTDHVTFVRKTGAGACRAAPGAGGCGDREEEDDPLTRAERGYRGYRVRRGRRNCCLLGALLECRVRGGELYGRLFAVLAQLGV
jgi:hypothetical protein